MELIEGFAILSLNILLMINIKFTLNLNPEHKGFRMKCPISLATKIFSYTHSCTFVPLSGPNVQWKIKGSGCYVPLHREGTVVVTWLLNKGTQTGKGVPLNSNREMLKYFLNPVN